MRCGLVRYASCPHLDQQHQRVADHRTNDTSKRQTRHGAIGVELDLIVMQPARTHNATVQQSGDRGVLVEGRRGRPWLGADEEDEGGA